MTVNRDIWKALVKVETYLRDEIYSQISAGTSFGGEDMMPVMEAYQTFRNLRIELPNEAVQAIEITFSKLQANLNKFLDLMREAVKRPRNTNSYTKAKMLLDRQLQKSLKEYQSEIERIAYQLSSITVEKKEKGDIYVFLSYRRSDTGMLVGRIVDRLRNGGIKVFFDIDSISSGELWKDNIFSSIDNVDALICIIGETWNLKRLNYSDDLVQCEIKYALKKGKYIIPILINQTPMPIQSELPSTIKQLSDFQAERLDYQKDFDMHINRIIAAIHKLVGKN